MTKTTPGPLTTRIAFALLWLFVFTLPLTQVTEIPAVGIMSKLAGLAAIAAGAVAVSARRRIRVLESAHMMMAAFIGWSAITLFWSVAPDQTTQRIMTYLQLFLLVILIWEFCQEEKDVLQILSAFVLGTILPALATLKAFLPGDQSLLKRASVPGFDLNVLAFTLAISLPVSYYLILREKRPISALYRMQMGVAVCAVFFTGSAATMIAAAVGLSLVCWTIHLIPAHTRNSAFGLIVLVGGSVTLFVPVSVWQHLSEESRSGGITATAVVNRGLESMHSTPVGGVGAGASSLIQHGFTMFSELGVVGVAFFVGILGVLFLAAERMSGATKSFWFTVLAVWAVGVCSFNWECTALAWLLLGLLAAHSSCEKQEGLTKAEQQRKRNYYVEHTAEVWS